MSSPIFNLEHSEEEWGARLKVAAEADRAARGQYRKALADYRRVIADPTSERNAADKSRLALDEAQRNEKVVRAEYLRILRIFKRFRTQRPGNHTWR